MSHDEVLDAPPPSAGPASSGPASWLSSATPAIRVRHLWHRFGRFDVLRDVSFEVGHGEIFGFIGPNGAGKTTTIRIMATLLEPLAGRVEIDGFDVAVDPEAVRKIIGYMPDHAGVYERVTVREYLEFFADAYKVAPDGNYGVVDAGMELTDLTKLKDKLVATMSKGMKQRLQLARTLLHDPKVLILDEPASDLDPRARIEIRDLLVELRNMGKTVFLSSHILTELADVCTSVAILERGRLVVAGPISDIARRLEEAAAARQPAQAPMQPQQPQGPSINATQPLGGVSDTLVGGGPMEPAPATVSVARFRKRAKVKTSATAEQVTQALTGLPNIFEVSPSPGHCVLVSYTGDEQVLASIVKAMVMADLPVAGIEPERNELERIFMEVTKGEVQ